VTVTEIAAGTTIFAPLPAHTSWLPRVNDAIPLSPPVEPLSSPAAGIAGTTPVVPPVFIVALFFLAVFGLYSLLSLVASFSRRQFQKHTLRPYAASMIQPASPEESMVDSICEEIAEVDNFWFYSYYVAWDNVYRLEREIDGHKSQTKDLEKKVNGFEEQIKGLEAQITTRRVKSISSRSKSKNSTSNWSMRKLRPTPRRRAVSLRSAVRRHATRMSSTE
jgi:hypothetical protein